MLPTPLMLAMLPIGNIGNFPRKDCQIRGPQEDYRVLVKAYAPHVPLLLRSRQPDFAFDYVVGVRIAITQPIQVIRDVRRGELYNIRAFPTRSLAMELRCRPEEQTGDTYSEEPSVRVKHGA
jgi:hypothetical protein